MRSFIKFFLIVLIVSMGLSFTLPIKESPSITFSLSEETTPQNNPPRFFVVSDIKDGYSDPDDHHSLIHLLHFSNEIDIVGFSTGGNVEAAINNCIAAYETDRNNNLATFNALDMPTPSELRAVNFSSINASISGLKAT